MSGRSARIGIVGAGHWGKHIIRVCHELDVLAAVCDLDGGTLAAVSAQYPAASMYPEPAALFADDLDGVIIAAPAQSHAQLALAAIEAGKHVFVEKPMALKLEDGQRMTDAAERAGRELFVGHLLLYHPAVKKLRALIAEGVIGRIWHVRSRRLSLGKLRNHESVLWSFAPHDIALALAIMGEEPTAASAAQTGWLSARLPDVAYVDFRFSMGRSAHVETSWLDPCRTARLDVYGSDGVLTFEDFGSSARLTIAACGARPDEHGVFQTWRGDAQEISVEYREPLREEIIAFLTSIRFGIPAESSAKNGLAVLRALTMADKASARGQEKILEKIEALA